MSNSAVGLIGAAATILAAIIAAAISYYFGKRAGRTQYRDALKLQDLAQKSQLIKDVQDGIVGLLSPFPIDESKQTRMVQMRLAECATKSLYMRGAVLRNEGLRNAADQLANSLRNYNDVIGQYSDGLLQREEVESRRQSTKNDVGNILRDADDILTKLV